MHKRLVIRTTLIGGMLVVVVLLLIARLYSLQIINGEKYRLTAERQYVSSASGIYDRGSIFTIGEGGGRVAAATVRTTHILAIDPSHVQDPDSVYTALNAILPLDKSSFDSHALKHDDPYEELSKELTEAQYNAIDALHMPGVLLIPQRERFYPGDSFAAQTIGFVAFDDNDQKVGRYGVERYYDDVLARDSSNLYVNFFAELFANLQEAATGDSRHEGDVVLTIDPELQVYLEEQLQETQTEWHSKMAAGIVMDPQTGAILAMAVSPAFNLNDFGQSDASHFTNPLVSSVYEMGSIIKVLTMAAGLDAGVVHQDSTYDDTGSLTLNSSTIHNYDGRARGVVPMQEVLSQSLNIGAAYIAGKVGHQGMRDYFLTHYRLGEETGIDLPAETVGIVNNLESTRDIEYATASFGQGVAFTPIETLRALATVSNGGYLVQPHVVREIDYANGLKKTFDYRDQREQVLRPESAETVTRMLTKIVDDVLTEGKVALPHYSLAAKTGTAQIASPSGGYYDDRYLHTFFGYGPSYNARFVILLMNLEPQGARYASETLTTPFINIAQFTLNHLNVPPDR